MKTKIFKSLMPFAILMFAVVAAFATQAKEMDKSALEDAYYQPQNWGEKCEEAKVDCTLDNTTIICTDASLQQVFGKDDPQNETSCEVTLYRPIP